ncbi:glycoside hydrolase family 2 protein [Pseudonocardia sp. CA-107938]|uniref:glycoside hydrolase family 2 protein n=1 Tax=Pseudonocardia sp. CA-107938 TaxID=3240021 RepID=UPI003D8C542C
MNDVPRPEHPRPTAVRPLWRSLNGQWEFEIDQGDSGLERGLRDRPLTGQITVPFAPESTASGIGNTDFLEAVWYARDVEVPAEWAGRRVLLHFGAVDHDATVWADGVEVVRHRGGFSSFTADLGERAGETVRVVVRARDSRHGVQARGKQATWYANTHCHYTRTTGIWQTVWLEAVPPLHVRSVRITPNLAAGTVTVEAPVTANRAGHRLVVALSDADGPVATASARADLDLTPTVTVTVPAERLRPWSPADPHLYDVTVRLVDADGDVVDEVESYTGIRSISIDGKRLLLNGEPVFQRLVLDQGWWPDTLMTAPSDAALVRDVELALAAGFNGARLHQKVFEERFLHHADRLGYLVWGEFGDWGASGQSAVGHNQQPTASFVTQWLEVLARDHNHPSIVGWCPLNETYQALHDRITVLDDVTRAMFLATKLADPTRPVIDASGYSHRVAETDVYDSHHYEQDPERFAELMKGLGEDAPFVNLHEERAVSLPYAGQPYFVSEFGGIWWDPDAAAAAGDDRSESWGYGDRVRDEEEFHQRFAGLTAVLLGDPDMFGYCYTQLTDVMQERNGIYRFDRSEKLDVARVRAAQQRPGAGEQER